MVCSVAMVVGGEVGFSAERVINAVNAGDCNVIKAISDCCCTTQRSIDAVNLNLTQMNAGNRYWVYYNKCDNVIQVMNHYTVAAAPAA